MQEANGLLKRGIPHTHTRTNEAKINQYIYKALIKTTESGIKNCIEIIEKLKRDKERKAFDG